MFKSYQYGFRKKEVKTLLRKRLSLKDRLRRVEERKNLYLAQLAGVELNLQALLENSEGKL